MSITICGCCVEVLGVRMRVKLSACRSGSCDVDHSSRHPSRVVRGRLQTQSAPTSVLSQGWPFS